MAAEQPVASLGGRERLACRPYLDRKQLACRAAVHGDIPSGAAYPASCMRHVKLSDLVAVTIARCASFVHWS